MKRLECAWKFLLNIEYFINLIFSSLQVFFTRNFTMERVSPEELNARPRPQPPLEPQPQLPPEDQIVDELDSEPELEDNEDMEDQEVHVHFMEADVEDPDDLGEEEEVMSDDEEDDDNFDDDDSDLDDSEFEDDVESEDMETPEEASSNSEEEERTLLRTEHRPPTGPETQWTRCLTLKLLPYNRYKTILTQRHTIYTFQPYKLMNRDYKMANALNEFPLARSGHRVIASESHLYSLGGYNPRSSIIGARRRSCLLFQELWSYNFATNRWKMLFNMDNNDDMPTELASNALAISGNILISHGGTGYPFGEKCSNDCYTFNVGRTRREVNCVETTGSRPTAQYGPGIILHEGYLYTIGGTTGFDFSCDVYRLHLRTSVWEEVYLCRPEMREDPEGRYRHELVYDGTHIYVLGGGTSNSVYDMQKIPAFNLETNKWEYFHTYPDQSVATTTAEAYRAGIPQPRKCFSCVQHTTSNGDIEAFITGGLKTSPAPGEPTSYFNDIWKLNLRSKQWTLLRTAQLPQPLYFHSAAHAGNGCMYIFGGIEYNEKEMRRRNDLLKMWITIPKLSEMCWDAITYYNENLHMYDRSTLLHSGVPKSFIDRLPPLRHRKNPRNVPSPSNEMNSKRSRNAFRSF